jgi:hypothetical protein
MRFPEAMNFFLWCVFGCLLHSHRANSLAAGVQFLPDALRKFAVSPAQSENAVKKRCNEAWHHPAVKDLFLDGLTNRGNCTAPGIASFSSSAALAISVLDDLSNQLDGPDRDACAKASKSFSDMLSILSAIPTTDSGTNILGAAFAAAGSYLRTGAGVAALPAALAAAAAAPPLFAGSDESLLRVIATVSARVRRLKPGEFCLIPVGWARKQRPDHILVRGGGGRRRLAAPRRRSRAAPP